MLIMCKGLPASGKSTWALAQPNCVVISSDDIRVRMGGFKPELEHLVKIEKLAQIRNALRKGQNVISDDPNYGKSIEKELRGLARRFGTEFQIHVFDTPIEECIRRDALRLKHIGADAIRKYLKYGSQSE